MTLRGAGGRDGSVTGSQLCYEEVRIGECETERPHAEERIRLVADGQVRDRFVSSDVEQPDRDLMRRERPNDPLIGGELLGLRWRARPFKEEELGSEEADALGAQRHRVIAFVRRADIGEERDLDTVEGLRQAGSTRAGPWRAFAAPRPLPRGSAPGSSRLSRRRSRRCRRRSRAPMTMYGPSCSTVAIISSVYAGSVAPLATSASPERRTAARQSCALASMRMP